MMFRSDWLGWLLRIVLGPVHAIRHRRLLSIAAIAAAVLLTLITQIGGLVLWFSWPFLEWVHGRLRSRAVPAASLVTMAVFLALHTLVSLAVVPPLASAFGRVQLPCYAAADRPLRAVSPLFCLTNRNYARPAVRRMLDTLSAEMARTAPGTVTAYLDAGFPFLDGFPMLPHLSHRFGNDIDLAFFYRRRDDGTPIRTGGSWPIGYWHYVAPRPGDPAPCAARIADLRWDLDWLQPAFEGWVFDEPRTGAMLRWLSGNAGPHGLRKILLEPHLQRRLATDADLVRFQGCRAARHDDHLHVQLR